MNERVGAPRIGQWYLRGDKGQTFLVAGFDDRARTIEIQTIEGDLDEVSANDWSALPLEFAEPPEDSRRALDADLDDGRGAGDVGGAEPQEAESPTSGPEIDSEPS